MDKHIPNTPIRFFWHSMRKYKIWAVFAMLAVTLAVSVETYTLLAFQSFIDAIASRLDQSIVWSRATLYVGAHLFISVFWRASGFSGMRWFLNTRDASYRYLFQHTIHQDKNYFANNFAGSLLTKVNNIVNGTQDFFQSILWTYYPITLQILIYFVVAQNISSALSIFLILWSATYVVVNILAIKFRIGTASYQLAQSRSTLGGKIVDSFGNSSAVHEYGAWGRETSYITHAASIARSYGFKSWSATEWLLVGNGVFMNVSKLCVIGITLRLLNQQKISIGNVVLAVLLGQNIIDSLWALGKTLKNTVEQYSNAQEGLAVILSPHAMLDVEGAKALSVNKGAIYMKKVCFQYDSNEVLRDFDLLIPAGQKVGVVGRSGAGKSTLVSLLLRNYDVSRGKILIDGQDIARVTRESLRKSIAFVPQDTSLFHRTLYENIAYASDDAKQEDVEKAAQLAQANEFICNTEKGYDTLVGERGVKLSGGQRQRIAIARAFLKNAPILILDEATSSLDSESETAIQKSLHTLMEGKTVIAIAHRLSTLKEMDRIIVVEQGKVVEDGAPAQLLAKKRGVFKSLWTHQAGGFIHEDE